MLRRAYLSRLGVLAAFAVLLSACGGIATPAPDFAPTLSLPTRVPIEPTVDTRSDVTAAPTTVAIQPTATNTRRPRPVTPTATTIPPTQPPAAPTEPPPPTATPGPDPVNGQAIFANGLADKPNMPTCASCHYVEQVETNDRVGPVMAGIAGRAGRGDRGPSPILYLRNSIVNPNEHVVANENGKVYSAGGMSLMYQDYAKDLTPAQIADLVAYLLTLR